MNADLGDLNEVMNDDYQVSSTIAAGRKPPHAAKTRPPKVAGAARELSSIRKSNDGVIARIKNETEKSRIILEKQAMLEQKRKQLSYEQAINNGYGSPVRSPGANAAKLPRSLVEPVNKVHADDKEKEKGCQDLVKKLRMEKKARQKKLDEYNKK